MKFFLHIIALSFLFSFIGTSSLAAELDINGFGSVYYGQALTPDLLPDGFYDKYPNFSTFSHIGFNVSSRISDRMSVATQLLAAVPVQTVTAGKASAPNTHWEMRAQWGFVTYDLSPAWTIKAGRQLLPVLFASEFSSVGYLMPYRQIPKYISVSLPFTGFDGVSANYVSSTSLGELRLISFTGTGNVHTGFSISGSEHNLLGLTAQLRGDGLQLHTSFFREDVDILVIDVNTPAKAVLNGVGLGYRYDKNNLVSWGEYFYRWNADSAGTFIPNTRGAYALLGYRIGAFMPRYMYAMTDQVIIKGFVSGAEHSHTFGLNYQLEPKAILKTEIEVIEVESGRNPSTSARSEGSTTSRHGTAIYAGVDFIF